MSKSDVGYEESGSDSSRERATESKLVAARGQVDLLSRLGTNGELDAKVGFAEVKRILAEMETGADADIPDGWTFRDLGI
ncbi:hypothetical protein BRD00_05925 [Halobacteriales archaeon QS_8_69_26]|nr:MAG: hypothetical protein BRD00_05925 [Halobacteriales archaeon QS_8_69_26]